MKKIILTLFAILVATAAQACERNGVLITCGAGGVGIVQPNGDLSMSNGTRGRLMDQNDFTNGWRSNRAPSVLDDDYSSRRRNRFNQDDD